MPISTTSVKPGKKSLWTSFCRRNSATFTSCSPSASLVRGLYGQRDARRFVRR